MIRVKVLESFEEIINLHYFQVNQKTEMRNTCNRFSILRILETDYTCQLFTLNI